MTPSFLATARLVADAVFLLLWFYGIWLWREWRRRMLLSKDDILKAEDVKTEEVEVPEWGGSVRVRGLTGRERDDFEATIMERRGRKTYPNTANIRGKLVARCIVKEDGSRMFNDADADALGAKSAAAMERVYEVAAKLSGMTDEDIEELVENFGGTTSGDSSSGSQRTSAKRSASS